MHPFDTLIPHAATRLLLTTALALGLAGTALASDISTANIGQVTVGASRTSVNDALGKPTEHKTYLFAPGSTDLYYITGGTLGNESVLAVHYGADGRVISSQRTNAGFFDLNRLD